jgi:type IV pilus assembly protein PilC
MIEYQYIAKTKDGEIQKGTVEAESESSAAKVLTTRNLYPVSVFVREKTSFDVLNHVSVKDKAFLIRQLATTINAGLPIAQALDTLKEQITAKRLRDILEQVSRDVEGGMPLSSSFARFPELFNQIDITLIAAGETSGTLDKVLLRLATSIENDYRITRKIRSALAYPAFILLTIIGVLVIMSIYVMPQMEELFASFGAKLPLATRVLLAISHNIPIGGPIFLLICAAAFFALRSYIKTENGRYNWDYLKLHMPIVGQFMQKLYLSRFSRTLSGLVASGVSLLDSLNIVSKAIGNKVYYNLLMEAAGKVKSGIPLSTPLKENKEFPPIVSQMVRIGEQTGELDSMLSNLADYYEDEVDNFVKSMTSVLEPVIIVVMAVIVGVILVSIMLPIYNFGKIVQ